jgi:hypothetical protein
MMATKHLSQSALALGLAGTTVWAVSLDITLTNHQTYRGPLLWVDGTLGTTNRLQYPPVLRPANAWLTLAEVSITNHPTAYVDVTATNLPGRYYRATQFDGGEPPTNPVPRAPIYCNRFYHQEAIGTLCTNNPDSGFISAAPLPSLTDQGRNARTYTMSELEEGAQYLLRNWQGRPPAFILTQNRNLSLASFFKALQAALSQFYAQGLWPASVTVPVFPARPRSPMPTAGSTGTTNSNSGRLSRWPCSPMPLPAPPTDPHLRTCMTMERQTSLVAWLVAALTCGSSSLSVHGASLYVDLACTNALAPYTNWATAATVIQDAVEAAAPGDTVHVGSGVYRNGFGANAPVAGNSNRVTLAKAITLRSFSGPALTVIVGQGAPDATGVRCVYLTNGAVLHGFTLRQGARHHFWANAGGGGAFLDRGGLVEDCLVDHCSTSLGGGVFRSRGGAVTSSTIVSNQALSSGGGAYLFQDGPRVVNSTLGWNVGTYAGGGAHADHGGTIQSCLIASNTVPLGSGGGAYLDAAGTTDDCSILGNRCVQSSGAGYGGGVTLSQGGVAQNSLIASNIAKLDGRGPGPGGQCARQGTPRGPGGFRARQVPLRLAGQRVAPAALSLLVKRRAHHPGGRSGRSRRRSGAGDQVSPATQAKL